MTAWSIFDLPNGDAEAQKWAGDLLAKGRYPATVDLLTFVYDWERSEGGGGLWNPTNCGPLTDAEIHAWGLPWDVTSATGQQYGGGASDYASRDEGIEATLDYLAMSNYTGVNTALRRGDPVGAMHALWASPWASGHYGYGTAWAHDPLPAIPAPPTPVAKPWPWATNIVQVHGHTQTWAHRLTGGHVDAKTQIPAGQLAAEQARQATAGHKTTITWLLDLAHNLDQLKALPTVAYT